MARRRSETDPPYLAIDTAQARPSFCQLRKVDAMGIARLLGKQQPDKYENSIGTHRRGE